MRRTGISRFGRPPERKYTAHAASAGSASRKYSAIAATFALVDVVESMRE